MKLGHAYGDIVALQGVDLTVPEGSVGLVGANGAGKTTLIKILLGILKPSTGSLEVLGKDHRSDSLDIRARVGYMPEAACLPLSQTAADFMVYAAQLAGIPSRAARQRASDVLTLVGLHEERFRYLGEYSTGMKQRAMIAIAMAGRPKLLIADEPTTALDLTVQAEIADLLEYIQERYGMAILMISHDLEMVAQMSDRLMVMYTGRIVEMGGTRDLIEAPEHPYTKGLLAAIPRLGAGSREPLQGIGGAVPDLLDLPAGCTFHPRCPLADDVCVVEPPPIKTVGYGRQCACYKVG